MIRFDGVTYRYTPSPNNTPAVHDVTLHVPALKVTALVGRSGSGKSTILNLMGGLATPDSGTILFNGVSLGGMTRRQLDRFRAKNIGFIFQDFGLIPYLTVQENIMLPLGILGAFDKAARKAEEAMHATGISDKRRSLPHGLSGGEQQRVAIARALVTHPPLVLADEPTANLDNFNADKAMECLLACKDEFQSTIVIATHDSRLLKMADQVIELNDGTVSY